MSDGYDPNAEPPVPAGTPVGEYVIDGTLGEGGFGAVYRAHHPVIGKAAAVKVLKREFSANPDIVSRFVSEARAVNQIRHKNIVDIFNFGVLPDGRQFFVMELLDGMPLDKLILRHGRFSPSQALPILKQVARALGAAHAAGIAHRDIKPENVMVTFDEDGVPTCKLLDFGIAKLNAGDNNRHKTRTGTPMGTPMYMSPEQVHGRSIDYRTDIYSFGIMVFEMLVGACPFDGESAIDVMMKQANQPLPRPTLIVPGLPPGIDAAIMAMVEKDPAKRPPGIVKAVDDFAAAVTSAGFPATAPLSPLADVTIIDKGKISEQIKSIASGPTILAPSTSQAFTSSAMPPAPKKGNGMIAVLAVVGVLAVGGGVGAFVVLNNKTQTPASSGAAIAKDTAAPSAVPSTEVKPAMSTTAIVMASAQPNAPPTPSAEPEAHVEQVSLTLQSNPPDADVFLEGKRIGAANEVIHLEKGDEEITLVFKKAGFKDTELHLTPDQDKNKIVALQRVAAPSTGTSTEW